jgi:hypothetical protein
LAGITVDKEEALAKMLTAIAERKGSLVKGISLASAYVNSIGPCLGDGACQAQALGLGDAKQWADTLKESANRLVYADIDLEVVSGVAPGKDGTPQAFGEVEEHKAAKELTKGSILDFEAVITSTKKDRDRDILESKGAILDDKMPLLWQHISMLPIGKYVELVKRTNRRIIGKFAVAPTALGEDAALLAEFGALRISHGFRPIKYEPLEKDPDDPDAYWTGFHVLEFEVMETSLVSVPSNTDAQITAQSRGKLHHPLTKSHAQLLWDRLPPVVKSGWEPPAPPAPPAPPTPDNTGVGGRPPTPAGTKKPCGCTEHPPAPKALTVEEVALDLSSRLRKGEQLSAGYLLALQDEVAGAQERLLEAELANL